MKRRSAFLAAALLTLLGVLAASSAAFGRSTADDLSLQIQLARSGGFLQGTTTTSPFQLGFGVEVDSGPLQTLTLRVTLPDGLHWGPDGPDPTEGCAGTAPAVCVQKLEENAAGTVGGGWSWDVVADRPGPYEVTATIQGERSDPNSSNNTDTFRFEVVASSGGGGGAVSVSASAVKLTPAKPKAGSAVVASATVTADGSPVKPSKVVCAGTLAGKKAIGTGKALVGKATCRFPTPRSAQGKTLAGSMAITARGKTITKRFSAKLG